MTIAQEPDLPNQAREWVHAAASMFSSVLMCQYVITRGSCTGIVAIRMRCEPGHWSGPLLEVTQVYNKPSIDVMSASVTSKLP